MAEWIDAYPKYIEMVELNYLDIPLEGSNPSFATVPAITIRMTDVLLYLVVCTQMLRVEWGKEISSESIKNIDSSERRQFLKNNLAMQNENTGRIVGFNKFIPKEPPVGLFIDGKYIIDSGHWEEDFGNHGIFSKWLIKCIGGGFLLVGIIEQHDGTIVEVLPNKIKFLN